MDFETAWSSLMREFDSLIYKRQEIGEELDECEDYDEYVETSFRLIRHFNHPLAQMGIGLTCDGFDAKIAVFLLEPAENNRGASTSELAAFQISYADLIDQHEEIRKQVVLSLQ